MNEELCPIQIAKLDGKVRMGKMKKGRKKGEYTRLDYDCEGCFAPECWEDIQEGDDVEEEKMLMYFIDKITERSDDISNFLAWFAHEYKGG